MAQGCSYIHQHEIFHRRRGQWNVMDFVQRRYPAVWYFPSDEKFLDRQVHLFSFSHDNGCPAAIIIKSISVE
jgi:hypothetical protein